MKKLYIPFILLLLPVLMQAQVTMQLQAPPLGLIIKPQLWNLSLVNATKEMLDVRIEMVMTDVSNNQRVLSGTTRTFMLPTGAKQVQVKDVVPVTYNPGIVPVDPGPDGFLPVGVFNICYTLIGGPKGGVGESAIAEACETFEIEPLSPPQLVSPMDQEVVAIPRPMFTWLPPAPVANFSRLQYDWILVEIQPTQSAGDAIQMNIPVLTRQRIDFTNFQYPQSAPELDTGKVYAWRITAKNNLVTVANSEVASFTVSREKSDSVINQRIEYYSRLHPTEDAGYTICTGTLRFEFTNEYSQQSLRYKLFDISNAIRREISLEEAVHTLRTGQNFLQIDVKKLDGMTDKHFYLLEATDTNNRKWYLKFEYKKS